MSDAFRELLRKVGSGSHTSKDLSRDEAAAAMRMMLRQEATPAQIGAFLISHRIKRPTSAELGGMLDAYEELGPALQPIAADYPVMVLGVPYDGRSRTAPVTHLTALMLSAVGCPVILHGGRRMSTKYGIPLVELWQGCGIDWTGLELAQVQQVFAATGLGFVYLPKHFPLAEGLVDYRDQIGKRPPLATLELMWVPYAGEATVVSGFVHPPTEDLIQQALALKGSYRIVTVKGLEGSCDLPRSRTSIIGIWRSRPNQPQNQPTERLLLHPRDYGMAHDEVPLESEPELLTQLNDAVRGVPSQLLESAVWNGGFYLYCAGVCADLEAGLAQARDLLTQGQVAAQLAAVQQAVNACLPQPRAEGDRFQPSISV